MRKAVAGFWWSPTAQGTPALVVTAVFFALGALVGGLTALRTADGGAQALGGYLEGFFQAAQAGTVNDPALSAILWRTLRWPALVLLSGFTALGILVLPALSALRGFFLAFSVASFARSYARRGLTMAFFLLGLPGMISLPVFFLLSSQSFAAAVQLACRAAGQGRRDLPYDRAYLFRCGVCAAALCVAIFLEHTVVPALIGGMAGVLS